MSSSGQQLARNRSVSSSSKSKGRATNLQDFTMSPTAILRYFEPCAATNGMFLYAQGNSIVCCHHDTLTIERRFSRHSDEVQLLAVDTQSEKGAGRLVVSYDAGQTAIVWDIMTGDEIARFASYDHLTAAAWMRNGNVAFGNTQGNIILFEPDTSEHISSRTLDQVAVTALAPAADCRTFAIGYQNGQLLICNLQPRFIILHNLMTSRGPSPIVNLAWHASSSRQKSDMLAVQTNDGDLRVWSVAKAYNSADPAKVVRILKRTENYLAGPNWMAWSKNGRIIQFSESETLSWDVRTKHVTCDPIPTGEHVRGLAVYGPGAILFTLGANNTVQQIDLNAPARLVTNVQHPANLLPPSPPVSIEEQDKGAAASTSESEISIHFEGGVSESDEDRMSPYARIALHAGQSLESDQDRSKTASPASSLSHMSSQSSASSRTPGRYQPSLESRGLTENTYISAGSSMRSSAVPYPERRERDSYSVTGSLSSVSMTSSHNRPRHKPSRLRHEMPRSPQDTTVQDLFKFTKSRLSDVPRKLPPLGDAARLTNDDLRRQMLSTIFGWTRDVRDLVRDEMIRHPVGSPNRILLGKWLGDIDMDIMNTGGSEQMTSQDWMMLALNGLGPQDKFARTIIRRMLDNGDVHAAATIFIGMNDYNDALELYVSHKLFMEALIVACMFQPSVWERQAQIVKKWGEWAVQHGNKDLAIRCLACAGKESTEPWRSPSAAQIDFQSLTPTIPEVLSPPLSPPGLQRGPQRSIAKTSALKLITSFGDQNAKSKYFAGQDDGQTPIAAGVTPIAESAISPNGNGGDVTAFLRPSQRSAYNTPSSARPGGAGPFGRQRLPSIGEVPSDAHPRDAVKAAAPLPTPPVDRTEHQVGYAPRVAEDTRNYSTGMAIPRAATASPMMMRETHRKREPPPPSPSPASMAALMEGRTSRNGPRNRIPEGIDMHLPNVEMHLQSIDGAVAGDTTSPDQSVTSSNNRYHWPRRGTRSVASSVTSTSSHGRSHRLRGGHDANTKVMVEDYIHSLDAASSKPRTKSREGRHRVRESSRSQKASSRERSGERGRAASRGYTPKAGKRSPRSPVPMSPEDLINLSTPRANETQMEEEQQTQLKTQQQQQQQEGFPLAEAYPEEPSTVRKASSSQIRISSKSRTTSRASNRSARHRSPDRRPPTPELPRGRGDARDGSVVRSPSSPLPMSANAQHYYASDDEEDYRKAMEEQEKFRNRANRSTSRGLREPSPGSLAARERSQSRRRAAAGSAKDRNSPESRTRTPAPAQASATGAGDLKQMKDERTLKKEAAARELEERRRSLARRPLAPAIPHPDELSPAVAKGQDMFETMLANTTFAPPTELPSRSQTAEPGHSRSMYASRSPPPAIGLPATPKAMRLIMEADQRGIPGVPPMPAGFGQPQRRSPPSSGNGSPRNGSPRKEESMAAAPAPAGLTLLPSTVYTPPTRPPIARSMSAPPEEPVPPMALQGSHPSSTRSSMRGQPMRKLSMQDDHEARQAGLMQTIDSLLDSRGRRGSQQDEQVPPPPPPPPMLKELAHLATPPPPPPAPLPFSPGSLPQVYGGQTSGTIEIVMDDGQVQPVVPATAPTPVMSGGDLSSVPIIPPPAPPSSRGAHHRGRSSVDNSIAGRISRATERMRSASRGRNNASAASRTKSPVEAVPSSSSSLGGALAPYESIPPPAGFQPRVDVYAPYESVPPPASYQSRASQQQQQQQQQQQALSGDMRTGLHESELI